MEHVFEDMSSSVLGGAISEWADRIDAIRVKSKNLQGKLNGEMKKCVAKIKDGTALLVARSVATGDPQFLRMRNSELTSQLRESENENARLKEQLRKMSLGPSPPRCKRKIDRMVTGVDVAQVVSADLHTPEEEKMALALGKEEFPPLPQRLPREMGISSGGNKLLPMAPGFSTAICDSEGTETGAEAYFTQHINFLTAVRDMQRKQREQNRIQMGLQEERKEDRTDDRNRKVRDGDRKEGPRIVSNIQVAPPFKERHKERAPPPTASGSEAE